MTVSRNGNLTSPIVASTTGTPYPAGCMFAGARVPMSGLSDGIQTNGTYKTNLVCPPPATMTVRDLRFVFCNLQATGQTEAAGANNITIKAAVDMGLTTVVPLLFNGQRSAVIEPGGYVVSDILAEEPGTNFSCVVYTYVSVTAGQKWPIGLASGTFEGYQNGSDTSLSGWSGSAVTSGVAPFGMYGPCAVIGTPSVAQPAIALLGDSVINGIGGDVTGTDVGFNPTIKATVHGWAERAIGYARGGFVQLGCNGESSSLWSTNQRLRNAIAKLSCNWAIWQMGANDGGNTLLAQQNYTLDVVRKYHAMGLKIAVGTILPRTSSTDSWATTVNQTSAWPAGVRVPYNQWVRANGCGADLVLDVAAPVESAQDSGFWKPAVGYTIDGVHPTAAASAVIAATIPMALFA